MKNLAIKFLFLLGIVALAGACKTEFENHNAASEAAVLQTPEAYPGMVLGLTKHFSLNALPEIARGPGVVSREIGATNTYTTENELESGSIPNDNSSIARLWRYLHYERGVAEKITDNIDDVVFPNDAEKAGIKAYAYFFRGMTTGYLGMYWEKAPIVNNPNNEAEFKSRSEVLNAAIDYLNQAQNILASQAGSADYINGLVSAQFSIEDIIHALKARYYLELGDYGNVITEADAVDLTKPSVWTYDGTTSDQNPIWKLQYDAGASERYKALDGMGVTPEAGDARVDFYTNGSTGITTETCGFNTLFLKGFWFTSVDPIPVYLPDEVKLMKAEAYAQQGGANLANAVTLIDEVRTDNSDIFGVNANLGVWTGNTSSQQDVLDQIYYNYAMECFFQGVRWNAHKRIYPDYLNGVTPPVDCAKMRTRNYFPYPENEKANNTNTPADPAI